MIESENTRWAAAIAGRLSDEWWGKDEFPQDALLLNEVLFELLAKAPKLCQNLIGTGIIEEDYFEPLE